MLTCFVFTNKTYMNYARRFDDGTLHQLKGVVETQDKCGWLMSLHIWTYFEGQLHFFLNEWEAHHRMLEKKAVRTRTQLETKLGNTCCTVVCAQADPTPQTPTVPLEDTVQVDTRFLWKCFSSYPSPHLLIRRLSSLVWLDVSAKCFNISICKQTDGGKEMRNNAWLFN